MLYEFPEQMVPFEAAIIGKVFTVIAEMAVLELTQPNELVPVIEYD